MEQPSTNLTVFWTALALAQSRCHAYGIADRIAGLSLMGFRPTQQRIKRSIQHLTARGYIARSALERSAASATYFCITYELTPRGWRWLRTEIQSYRQLLRVAEQALTRQNLREHQLAQAEELAQQFTRGGL